MLATAFDDAVAGRGHLVLLVGEPGIGKTRLAEEIADQARARGARVVWGRCWEGDGAPAFWPWAEAMRQLPGERDAPLHDAPARGQAPAEARFELFDRVTQSLASAAAEFALLVVLDDLHWADEPSLHLLHFVARDLADLPILVVGTYRDTELDRRDPRARALARLARSARALTLRGLGSADVARFVAEVAGTAPSAAVLDMLVEKTDGNPFFLSELVRLLSHEGRLRGEAPDALRIPEGVRQTIRRRLDALSPAGRDALGAAAVVGRTFSVDGVIALAPTTDATSLAAALDDAAAAGLVVPVGTPPTSFRFAHALVRETVYEDLPTAVRSTLHRLAGESLEGKAQDHDDTRLAEIASHLFLAATPGDVARAVGYATRAAERSMAALAYEDAARLYEAAIGGIACVDGRTRGPDRVELLLALGEARACAGDTPGARASHLDAAAAARELGLRAAFGRAALGVAGRADLLTEQDPERHRLLEEALATVDPADSALRARLLARTAAGLYFVPGAESRRAHLSAEAVAMAERIGDDATLASTLGARHLALWGPDDVAERLRVADRAVSLAERAGSRDAELAARLWRFVDHLQQGDVRAADVDLQAYARLALTTRQPFYAWMASSLRVMRLLLEGRFAEAEPLVLETAALGERARSANAPIVYLIHRFMICRELGRMAEIEEPLRMLVDQMPSMPAFRSGLAHLYAELGRESEARLHFEMLATRDFVDLPRDANWLNAMDELARACAFLGDVPRARVLYDLLRPYDDQVIVISTGHACNGSVGRPVGMLATTLGRFEDAAVHFERALAVNARMGARPDLAHAQREYAAMLLRRDGAGDRARAEQLLAAAMTTYGDLGMQSSLERARTLQAPRGPSVAAVHNVFRRDGGTWTVAYDGVECHLPHAKGLQYIGELLRNAGRDIHVAELVGTGPERPAGAAALPDRAALDAYRARLSALREQLAEAESWEDRTRAVRAREEIDALEREVATAFGIGGHAHAANEPVERLRKAVGNRIRDQLLRLEKANPALWGHLSRAIRTGVFCCYSPERPTVWDL